MAGEAEVTRHRAPPVPGLASSTIINASRSGARQAGAVWGFAIVLGRPTGWRETSVYGSAHLGKSLFWYASELLFAFYLTELVGLPASQMGMVLAIGLLVSAAIDLIVARVLDSQMMTAAGAAALQFKGSILCAIAFASIFLGFWIPPDLRFAYALATGLAFRTAYAIYDLPQNALMALATSDAASRDRVAATRIWFSGIATLMVAGAVGPLIAGRDEATAWLYFGLAVGIAGPAILSAGLLARVVRGTGTAKPVGVSSEPRRRLAPPPLFWILIALMFLTSLATPLFSKVEPYFAAYSLASPSWGGVIVVAMALGITLGQPIWNALTGRLSRAAVLGVGALTQAVGLGVFWALAPAAPAALAASAFVFGVGNGGVGMVLWGGFSDVVARFTQPGGAGRAYGLFTATAKVALALGGLGLGAALQIMDYRDGDADGLLLLMIVTPGLGALGCLALALAWERDNPDPVIAR
ncbi:MFS transporter [Brevundimonas aurifodinae]|uniref:MFS transporter n=2 Tax=Brevundimonas TaxID=41275 RepID=A0ABV1NS42_9CAUL|nr:MAG: hypothetical protein B7Z01_14130 [Brevundimonas subvibrioides]